MLQHSAKIALNTRTRDFIREQTGVELTEAEAEEVRQSLVRYCRLLAEIAEEQQEAGAYEQE